MGCDYYIVKSLKIKFINDRYPISIELERKHGYYDFSLDSNDSNYDKKEDDYIQNILTPKMKPIIIYKNNEFKTENFESIYKWMIEKKLKEYSKEWNDVIKIIIFESRFERS